MDVVFVMVDGEDNAVKRWLIMIVVMEAMTSFWINVIVGMDGRESNVRFFKTEIGRREEVSFIDVTLFNKNYFIQIQITVHKNVFNVLQSTFLFKMKYLYIILYQKYPNFLVFR